MEDVRSQERGTVSPVLPLALLESMRDRDRPTEVLEDEDFTASLPRRLGLSEVVFVQIRRYQDAIRRGDPVPVAEVHDLLKLVLRRPDAEAVLRDTGAAVARRHFRRMKRPLSTRVAGHGLPRALVMLGVRRTVRRMLNRVLGRGTLESVDRPLVVRIRHPFTAETGGEDAACVLFSAAIEEIVRLYTHQSPTVRHTGCEAAGAPVCEWSLESA